MKKSETCPECGGSVAQKAKIILPDETVAGARFRVTIVGRKCRACGESFVSGEILARKELMIAERLLRGPAKGEVLKYARKALGLRAADLANILQVDAVTISRWETGKVTVDRAAWLFLWSYIRLRLRGDVVSFPEKEETLGDENIDLSA